MKLKRIFSLLLAFAMLASLLPANIVFAGEESIEPIKYVFTSAATKEGESVDLLNGGTFTLNNEVSTGTWSYVGNRQLDYINLGGKYIQMRSTSSYKELGSNGLVLKVTIPEKGLYRPKLSYAELSTGAKISAYFVDPDTIDPTTEEKWDFAGGIFTAVRNAINDAENSAAPVVKRIISGADTSTAAATDSPALGSDVELEAKDYYLIIAMDGSHESQQFNGKNKYFANISGLELQKLKTDPTIELGCSHSVITVGGVAELRAVVRDFEKNIIKNAVVSYTTDSDCISLDGNIVTGKSVTDASALVTATYSANGKVYADTFEITVIEDASEDVTVQNPVKYLFTTLATIDGTAVDFHSGGIFNRNKKESAQWSYVGNKGLDYIRLSAGMLQIRPVKANKALGSNALVLKIKVPFEAEYTPSFSYTELATGGRVSVYLVAQDSLDPFTGDKWDFEGNTAFAVGNAINDAENGTDPIVKRILSGVDTSTNAATDSPAVGAKLKLDAGEYYLLFALDGSHETQEFNAKDRYFANLVSFELKASAEKFENIGLSLDGVEKEDPIAQYSMRKINVSFTDRMGITFSDGDFKEVPEISVSCKMQSEDGGDIECAVSKDGQWYLDAACMTGKGKVFASVTYEGKTRNAELDFTVAEVGKNLLDAEKHNTGFENDNWVWTSAPLADAEPAEDELWWRYYMIDEDSDGNRALKCVTNPKYSAADQYGLKANGAPYKPPALNFVDGEQTRIKVRAGGFYQLSYKIKIEDWQTPVGYPNMSINNTLYAMTDEGKGLPAIPGSYSTKNLSAEEGYVEKYSDWKTVTFPIYAPIKGETDAEYVYLSPSIYITPPTNTALKGAGYGGTVWLDDFELREVGYKDIEVAYSGITDTGVESVVSVSVTPRTTTGEYISFSEKCLEDLTFISSDTDVLGDIQHIDCAESYTGSGVWRGSTAGRLGGKNGTTFLQAEMTLNGVTRSGMNTLSSSGFRQRLFSINASAKALEMSEESTSRINVTGTMSDGTDASEALGSAEFIYKSLTPDIVSVSADGVVAPLAVGTGIVEVTVATEGAVLKTDAQIEVTPASGDGINPDTVSLYVTDNEAGYQREERIYLSAQTSNGYTVHDSYFVSLAKEEKLEWEYDSQNILITRNDDGFYISGEKLGTTSQLKAKISLGEEEKAVSVSVTVVKRDPRDVIIDFGKTSAVKVQDVTLQKDGWEVDAESSYTLPALMGSYMNFRPEGPERDLVINVNIPYDGYYSMMLVGSGHGYKAAEDVDIYLDGAYAGDYCFYNNGGSGVIPAETFRTFHLEKGVHTILFRAQKNTLTVTNPLTGEVLMQNATDEYVQNIRMVCFNALEELPVISGIDAVDELSVETGKERKLDVKILFEDGTSHIWQSPLSDGADDYFVTYEIVDGNDIVTVSADGVISAGETTGIAKVEIIARDSISGKQAKKTVAVDVTEQGADDYIFKSLEIRAEKFTMKPYEKGIELHASALAKSGNEFNLDSASFSWALSAQDALMAESDALEKSFTVKPSGAGKEGTAIVTLTVTLADGSTHTAEKQVSVRNGKTESTYYTSERVANARENIRKYKWAKSQKDTAVKKADTYMQRGMDEMWRMIPGEGMPRVIWIGFNGDNDKFKCRYCGVNAQLETGSGYPWLTNALTRPWKIQCPSCKRVFPSNDFESFYELGVSASNDGVFDIETALKAHAEKFGGKTYGYGYLKNDLYPELRNTGKDPLYNCDITHGWDIDYELENIADVWGVDDGAGYDTGRKNETGARIVYPYIGYYLHEGLWHGGEIEAALNAFRDAYVYTGDEKYGRIGAVMLDRIADLYPDMSIRPWDSKGYYVGNTNSGKITNDTWEPSFAKEFALAYDAFFDMYDDSAVQQFIQHKAEEFPGILVDSDKNPRSKETALDIRENIEENILLEAYDAVWSYDMSGNFGGHQSVLAFVAIVYDNEPKTTEMIEWIFNEEITDRKSFNAGGGVGSKYVNEVSRDGQGTESGPGYNELWVNGTMNLAEALEFYKGDYENSNLWTHPKYLTMIRSYNPLTLLHRGLPPIGDSGSMGKYSALPDTPELLLNAYKNVTEKMETTEDPEEKQALRESAVEIAQLYYRIFVKDDDFSGARLDIFTKDPESIQDELASIIEEYGEYDYDKSSMLSGYGFAALRDGKLFESVGGNSIKDTTRDFWMYFGGASSHAHADALELNVDAYGISMTSDNGYPEATGTTPSRTQWTNVTLSHNTVVVNESNQNVLQKPLKPLHFDAKDTRVKVLDVDGAEVYPETDEYRRTVVMIDYDDEISYGVDFFKVLGGNDHTYSFHASGDSVHDTNLDDMENYFVQKGGTYAGADVAFGNDPYTNAASTSGKLKYPSGYTWLENIRKVEKPENDGFYVDYNIKDVAGISRNPKNMMDIHLRLTMLNDWRADEIVLAQSVPPRRSGWDDYISRYEYMLVRRKGEQLNTLFTTVIEPYNKERYITGIARVGIEPSSETSVHPSKTDKAAALKIELRDGRIDYVVYAQNGDVTYTVTDGDYSFDFKGFVGVWTVNADNRNVYSYLNDAEILADIKGMDAAISGEVTGFTEELSLSNYIEVNFDRAITDEEAENLADRMINVEFKNSGNAAYVIRGVKELSPDGTSAKLDIGNITPINSYKDMDAGTYNYDVAVGKTFEIPMSYEENKVPEFMKQSNVTTSAGSSVKISVKANSQLDDGEITYSARTLPRGASFNAKTGAFVWKPDASQVGESLVAIDAADSMGRTSTLYFTVTVYGSTTGNKNETTDSTSTGSEGSSGAAGGGGGGGGAPTDKGDEKDNDEDPSINVGESVPALPQFADLGNHAWAENAINALAADGIIKGTSASTFSPAANITRADFALLLVRAFDLTSDSTENFADVMASDYFAPELAIARNTGIVNGIGDNKYAPRNTITRQDMMVIVYRAMRKLNVGFGIYYEPNYEDFTTVADYAKEAVSALISEGLVNGKNGLIDPTAYTTRAEVAVLIKRILDYVK